jgi:adenosylcobinamide-GDP ribazoletransferase
VAVQFLTRLPVPITLVADARERGRSVLYYPLVGLILGAILATLYVLLADAPTMLRAALLLAAWVLLSGALHLDGLADSADAWIGGLGNRQRTLAIMKDPYCGPAAVVALFMVLLVKSAALYSLQPDSAVFLALVPTLARSGIPLLFLTTPYVRRGGAGAAIAAHLPRTAAAVVIAIVGIATIVFAGATGWWLLLTLGGVFIVLRAAMLSRIGGTTGDTAGALIELTEMALLVALALLPG